MSDCSTSYLGSPEFMILACHCLAGVQLPVFLFGAFCILFKTPSHMTTVKWILLNTQFWTSLSDFTITILTVPYIFIPAEAGYDLGIINNSGWSIYLLVTVVAYSGVALLATYENRYFHLFGQKTRWRHFRKPYFFMIYVLIPFMFVPPFFNVPDQETARLQVLASIPCLPKFVFDDRKMYVLSVDFEIPVICVACALIFMATSFIIFLSLTFWNICVGDAWAASRQTMALQKSFTKGVTVQTIYEFFILFIPVVTVLFMIIIWYHNQIINNICFLILSLNGIGSTIIMLFAHKPYRTFTLSIFCPLMKKKKESIQWRSNLSAIL